MKILLVLFILPLLISCSQPKYVRSNINLSSKLNYNAIGLSLDFAREYKTTDSVINMLWIEEVVDKLIESKNINSADAHLIRQFWAYILFDKEIKDPRLVTLSYVDKFEKSANVPISDEIETVPPHQLKAYSSDKSKYAIAAKLWSNGNIWKRQIMLYNSATEDMITDKMKQYVLSLRPNTLGPRGDTYKYYMFTKEFYPPQYQQLVD